jgi:class 3 adenylate cyclase
MRPVAARCTTAVPGACDISGRARAPAAELGGQLGYRLVLAVDVEGYSSRSARDQLLAQRDLVQALDAAAARSGLDRRQWHRQVTGDGELAVLPGQADVAHAVGVFPGWLRGALADLNAARSGPRLRVRLALHHGTLIAGPFGPAGDAPIVASRLLDARPLRQFLVQHPGDDLALVVSRGLFREVVCTGFCCQDPAAFDPVRITVKGIAYHGYLHLATSGGRAALSPGRAVVQIRAAYAFRGGQPAGGHAPA